MSTERMVSYIVEVWHDGHKSFERDVMYPDLKRARERKGCWSATIPKRTARIIELDTTVNRRIVK